jgi:hypothetical protein
MSADEDVYTQYVEGIKGTSSYDYLISGRGQYSSSGLMLKSDTSVAENKGTHLYQDASDNAYFDLRTDTGGTKKIGLRIQNFSTGVYHNALSLTDDNKESDTVFGAEVGGRIKASQFHVGEADNRTPVAQGVYVGQNSSNIGYFNINKGSGTGGFAFNTYDASGNLSQNNLNLAADGKVQAVAYSKTTEALDSETYAIASFDASGNLVRNYQQNARLRSVEERVTDLESEMSNTLPKKVNQIIGRINGLKFFSNDIEALVIDNPPTPYPL